MAAVLIRPNASEKSRLRLFVVQAMVLALFLTLFARLWYMQVLTGEGYRAQAASQSVRDVVVQPARGLIVDDMGRPLVANRSSWVVSVDRTLVGKLPEAKREATLKKLARVVKVPYEKIHARTLLCGQPDSQKGTCWNGSPYQPVPVARDVPQKVAVKVLEQSEDYPGVLAQQESVRAYPSPFGVNGAHVLGYLSPITEGELDEAKKDDDTSVNGASVVGRAGVEKAYDAWLRGKPGYKKVAVDSMGRVLGDSGEIRVDAGRHAGHLDRRRGAVLRGEAAPPGDDDRARHLRQGDRPQLRRRQRCRGRDGGQDRPDRRDGQPADVQPRGVVRRHHQQASSSSSTPRSSGNPLLSRASQGQFAPGLDLEADHDGRARSTTGSPRAPSSTARRASRWATASFKNYESGGLRLHRLRQGPRALLRHLLLPRRAVASGRSTAATRPT